MKRWYVAQIYAGFEQSVKEDLMRSIEQKELQDRFGQVLVPSARMKQMFDTVEQKDTQLFPGYLFVEMELSTETMRLVLSNPRVSRFLGGKNPVPLSQKEVDRIFSQIKGEVVVAPRESEFSVGSEVDINEGPFAGFVGIIEKIDEEGEKLTVMVSIFGRMTPVELGFSQVKR
ncbi:transcription termination/antitermination factor NusG [Candidatus Dependentiae bacterium]|nr:transcription termination/antitermination factor NusG [Candidatus Dependentiae bacterium]